MWLQIVYGIAEGAISTGTQRVKPNVKGEENSSRTPRIAAVFPLRSDRFTKLLYELMNMKALTFPRNERARLK